MNSPAAGTRAAQAASAATAPAAKRLTRNTLLTLVRREFWEHRVLWMAPLAVAGLLLLCALPAHVHLDMIDAAQWRDPDHNAAVFALAQWGLAAPHFLVMAIVLSFYLLDCLYAERRDRSILFWKSLPVSDGVTVGSKLLVALGVVPLGVFGVALVTNLLFTGIWNIRASIGHSDALVLWDTVTWLKAEAAIALLLIVSMLWYAPLAAYLLPVVAPIVERLAFGTHYSGRLISYRMHGSWAALSLPHAFEHSFSQAGHGRLMSASALLDGLNVPAAFANIDLWLGLLAAGAFAFAAARVRRYRDDG
ncbi:MAG: hypothetical protein E6K52_05050 [Gammaproteobacteria bacterium]|nr:MAG: hypothetical protein E6K52_05050 [Gammaproteobacteria bacterium]